MVNDWLKFAEAKNGLLLAFSGAGVTAILTYVSAASSIPKPLTFALLLSITLLCCCSLLCSLSFLPRTNLEHIVWLRGKPARSSRFLKQDSDNFYYFGHLVKYHASELLDALNRLYLDNKVSLPYKKEYLDLASQITINSEIAFLKFKLFFISLWILIIAVISVPICLLISFILSRMGIISFT